VFKRVIATAALLFSALSAGAATSNAVMIVGATVLNVCVIGDSLMLFGNLSVVTNALGITNTPAMDTTVQVPVLCSNGTTASIEGGLGQNASGTERRMKHLLSPTSFLPYAIYKDSSRTQVFGTGSNAMAYTGTGLPDLVTMYGRITGPAVDGSLPGIYADAVSMVLTYTP
jgi:spore coat protein U-like protein